MGNLLKLKCSHSPLNLRILSSTSVPFTLTTVPVLNLALTHKKRITVRYLLVRRKDTQSWSLVLTYFTRRCWTFTLLWARRFSHRAGLQILKQPIVSAQTLNSPIYTRNTCCCYCCCWVVHIGLKEHMYCRAFYLSFTDQAGERKRDLCTFSLQIYHRINK